HGTQGRTRQGLAAVAFDPKDPKSRVAIIDPAFNAEDISTWGFADPARRVWGLGVQDGRLFYASVGGPLDGPKIWSVGLDGTGEFADDARVEIEVRSKSGDPVTAITFGDDGTMYLSQRGQRVGSYDYKVMATPGTAEVLRYRRRTLPDGKLAWQPVPDEYAIGHSPEHRSSNGGVALGYGYDERGFIRHDICDATVWTTGEILRQSAKPNPRLTAGGETIVHGLQGNVTGAVRPDNAPPDKAYFVDYDSQFVDPGFRGHMGQVAIWSCGIPGSALAGLPPSAIPGRPPVTGPRQPGRPDIRVAKHCTAAGLGNQMHCRVTLTNAGSAPPRGPVGFDDGASILVGPPGVSAVLIVSAAPDDPAWVCSGIPANALACEIDGSSLRPGDSRSVDVIMDVSPIARTPGFRLRNCASLRGSSRYACAPGGGNLIVRKKGPKICDAGGFCTFEISVSNNGPRTFDGNMFLADNMSIPGVASVNITWIAPRLPGCNPTTLPFQCIVPMTLGAGATRTFEITVEIPQNAVQPGGRASARNCFFASDPHLVPNQGLNPVSFWKSSLKTLNPTSPLADPGYRCWNFEVISPGPPGIVQNPGCAVPVATLKMTPTPATFARANETIRLELEVTHTGNNPSEGIKNWQVTAPGMTTLKCPRNRPEIVPLASAFCDAEYITTAADVGRNISLAATATGGSACGPIAPATGNATISSSTPSPAKPAVTLSTVPTPATFSAANQVINFAYTVTNTGNAAFTSVEFFGYTGDQNVKCPPANTGPQGGPLAAGASMTCTGSYTTKASDVGKDITKLASVQGMYAPGREVNMENVPSVVKFVKPLQTGGGSGGPGGGSGGPGGGSGGPVPGLTLTVGPAPSTFSASGQTINYVYKVTNNGKVPVKNFTVIDSKASGINCNPNGGPVAPGASVICTGSYETIQNDVGRNLVNNGTVYGKTAQGKVQPAGATGVVTFVSKPVLDLVMRPQYFSYSGANQQLGYYYVVTNTGSVPITAVSINDGRVPNINCGSYASVLNPGSQLTCNGSYITNTYDVGNDIRSIATVSGTTASGAAVPDDSDDALVKYIAPPTPKLDLVSVVPQIKRFNYAGQIIPFTFTVQNVGNVLVGAFRLTLPPERGGTPVCSPVPNGGGPLGVGAKTICKISYTTTQADVARGTTVWDVVLDGRALLAPGTIIPLKNVIKTVGAQCSPGDVNCGRVTKCGTMEPKWMTSSPNGSMNGYVLGELFLTRLNPNYNLYKPWFTGCRGNTAFTASFRKIVGNHPPGKSLQKAYQNRACDIFCSKNHAPRNCTPKDPGPSNVVVDEVPAPGSPASKNKVLWICPWKIDATWTGLPVEPAPVPPPQDSTFCWKPGGSGGCPSGYTDCGLGCQQGGSFECGIKIANQVFDTLKAIPLFGDIVGKAWGGLKKLFGFGKTATKTVSNLQKANIIKKFLQKRKAYREAKELWAKTQRVRDGWKAARGIDLSSSLVNRAAGSNIPRIGGPGFGQQGNSRQKFWGTLHDVTGIASLIPGPVGKIAGLIDSYADPECKR
ncbi:MAG: hypothetical protein OEM91_03795, partial [Hyphomicrobiales bacterium]|nr:hypothetical protein [Hyphomicrobiales bacterium]